MTETSQRKIQPILSGMQNVVQIHRRTRLLIAYLCLGKNTIETNWIEKSEEKGVQRKIFFTSAPVSVTKPPGSAQVSMSGL